MAEKTRNTFQKTRLALFVRTYVAHSIKDHLISKYEIDGRLPRSQLRKQYLGRRSIPEISRLSKALILDRQLLWQFIVLDKTKGLKERLKTQKEIQAYLAIENEIITLKITREDKENMVNEDYERAILSPAIERAAGNNLRDIKEDSVFEQSLEELKKDYRRWYYEIAYRYKLPTPRILAFILRLITS